MNVFLKSVIKKMKAYVKKKNKICMHRKLNAMSGELNF